MLNHTRPAGNAIMEDSGIRIKTKVDEIKSFMDEVYCVMVKMGAILKIKFWPRKMKNEVFVVQQVLITLVESVKIFKICFKQ